VILLAFDREAESSQVIYSGPQDPSNPLHVYLAEVFGEPTIFPKLMRSKIPRNDVLESDQRLTEWELDGPLWSAFFLNVRRG